jgi:hypothetical protein
MITALIRHTNHGRTEDTEHNLSVRAVSPWPSQKSNWTPSFAKRPRMTACGRSHDA